MVLFTLAVFQVRKKYVDRVYPGVYLFSTLMSGKTREELDEFLVEKEKRINQQKIVFLWRNNDQKRWEVIPQMLDYSLDKEKIIEEVFQKGRMVNGLDNVAEIYRLLVFPQEVNPKINYNADRLLAIAEQMAQEVDRPMQNALFEFKEGKVINFQQSKEGKAVNKKEVISLILMAFRQSVFQKPVIALDLPVDVIVPQTTTSSSNRLGIKELLGQGDSYFKDSIPSRVHNIILASSYLHGIVIPPGEVFSFSEKIGDISAKTGYQQAYVIKEGKTILDDGGGVCQVSTTIFRAALAAGLPIVERKSHYYRVGFYEQGGYPPGLDATVYPPNPDFKFKNDTPAYILIQTEIDKVGKKLTFKFYGTSDGRRVEMEKPVIHSQTPPPEPIYVDDPNLSAGSIKRVDVAHWGAKVSFKRKVWSFDNRLIEERIFWSFYTPWPAVYQRGTRI